MPLCLALIGLLLGAPATAADRVALVIGNSAYQHVSQLGNPINDAGDFAALLRKLDFDVVEGRDLDRKSMEDAIGNFRAKLEHAKLAVFFYAGHGLQLDGRNYLVPVDAEIAQPADLNFQAVNLDYVLRQMDVLRRVNLIFLDACRNNPFASTLQAGANAPSVGLAPIKGAIDTMIAFSTDPDSVALDGTGRNSPYTAALLKYIPTPATDISRIMRLVRQDVLAATNRQQVPWEHLSLVEDVILARGSSGPPAAAGEPRLANAPPLGEQRDQQPALSAAGIAMGNCDRLAADPFSPTKPANVRGVNRNIVSRDAIKICSDAIALNPDLPRLRHELGRALYTAGDYPKAIKTFEASAALGVVESTTELCRMYFFGHGLAQSYAKALELCAKAAKQGDPSAIKNIGFFFHMGYGVKQSYATAIQWYNLAPNHPTVMNNMGVLYRNGQGVPKNLVRARELYEKAVLGGDEVAMSNLAELYEKGEGVRRDLAKAKLLYQMGTALGDPDSRVALARFK